MRYQVSCILFLLAMTTRELAAACCSKTPVEKKLQKKLSLALLNNKPKEATKILNRNAFNLSFSVMDYYKKWDGKIAYTPLQYAIVKKQPDLALLMLQKGANPTFYYAPHTPAELAAANDYEELLVRCDEPSAAIFIKQAQSTQRLIDLAVKLKKLELDIATEINGLPEEYKEIEEKAYEA